ncbi:GbsR/MarR family transcriptional regulator [Flexivirga meconopsidis]|uniref:GbsR/MarR family transcriptional regulator n=1 Tax=Flexivirga meconopsidis TaxID=2977121 RepID=UPI00223F5F89|nr:MarR family transcriptional regulator [Flexivirga meconopsidis]
MTPRSRRSPAPAAARRAFVETLGDELTRAGMNRMAARVFAALVSTDEGRLTAADLQESLHASAGAISGAVRYLEQVHMVERSRPLGSRRDEFSVADDIWYEGLLHRGSVIDRWHEVMSDGAVQLGADTPAGERLAQMADFFAFLQVEMPALLEKWRSQRG